MNPNNLLGVLTGIACGVVVFSLDLRRRGLKLLTLFRVAPFIGFDVVSAALAMTLLVWSFAATQRMSSFGIVALLQIVLPGAIFVFLWGEGLRANQFQRPSGIVTGEFLVLYAIADAALAWLSRGRPVLKWFDASGVMIGALILAWTVPRFMKKREEHHILERISRQGEAQQPEYTPPTAECPHPERWTMLDSMSAEVEILEFLKQVVLATKPELIVETGTFIGESAIKMAEALRANGYGRIVTCEFDPVVFAKAKERIEASGLAGWIECRNQSSLEMEIEGTIDVFFSDSDLAIRENEIRHFLKQIRPNGLILMHDTSSHYAVARQAAFRLEQEGLISMILLSTPRGLMMAQKRADRI